MSTEAIIQNRFYYDFMQAFHVILPNVHIDNGCEIDLFCIRASGYCEEFEIKLTASDFKNDFKKTVSVESEYFDLNIPPNSIIYCDPPYQGTTKYKDGFDHEMFWHWCRNKTKQGHKVFVSEYNAPDDFKCVWQKEIVSSLTKNTGSKKGVEKLFILMQ